MWKIASFLNDGCLRSISTGVTADTKVNAETAKDIGTSIIRSMEGKRVVEHKFRRTEQAVTIDVKVYIKIDGETINFDPQLFF